MSLNKASAGEPVAFKIRWQVLFSSAGGANETGATVIKEHALQLRFSTVFYVCLINKGVQGLVF